MSGDRMRMTVSTDRQAEEDSNLAELSVILRDRLLSGEECELPGIGKLALAQRAIAGASNLDQTNLILLTASTEFIDTLANSLDRPTRIPAGSQVSTSTLQELEVRRLMSGG